MTAERPRITACLCTHNRPYYVRGCLEGLRGQSVGDFAILVIDSGSRPQVAAQLAEIVAGVPNARLLRTAAPGVSAARNLGAAAAGEGYIAYLDDDAIPAPDWIAQIRTVLAEAPAAILGGRVLPQWEAPLPAWWPAEVRGILSIVECEGSFAYRAAGAPAIVPCAANMVVHVPTLLAAGGFSEALGRYGEVTLSDEEVQLAWRMQADGHAVRYDSRPVVHHRIQAYRLQPGWLLDRLYWQGASTVLTRRALGDTASLSRELPRRLLIAALFAPLAAMARENTRLLAPRWRLAYARGFVRAALGWRATAAARQGAACLGPVLRVPSRT